MKKRVKFKNGTGAGGVNSYVVSPNETLAEYQLMLDNAKMEGDSNVWANTVIPMASSLLTKLPGMLPQKEGLPENALGNSNASGPIEVEGGEILQSPNGQMQKVNGPSHENGGVDTNVDSGTVIFSDQLKRGGKTMAERKEAREKRLANLEKEASKRKGDIAASNTLDRMKMQLDQEEESDLMMQELASAHAKLKESTYALGTGATGVPPIYGKGYTNNHFEPYMQAYALANPGVEFDSKAFQRSIGTLDDGVFGKGTFTAAQNKYGVDPFAVDVEQLRDINTNPKTESNVMSQITEASPVQYNNTSLTDLEKSYEDSKPQMERDVEGYTPSMGDVTGIIGNIFSATAPLNNTMQNRAGDTPNINPYKDFGKDALQANQDATKYVESVTANAKTNNRRNAISAKRSARNSSRGLNQQRATDMAIDLEANNQELSIDDSNSSKLLQLLTQKSQLENQQDQMVMMGEGERDMNNRKDRDAFYTQKGKDLASVGKGIQQIGSDLNDIMETDIQMKMLNQMSKYFQFDSNGQITEVKEQETKASRRNRRKNK